MKSSESYFKCIQEQIIIKEKSQKAINQAKKSFSLNKMNLIQKYISISTSSSIIRKSFYGNIF